MATERSNGRYYLQRKVPGVGDVYRSLRTCRAGVARRREGAVMALAERGRADVVRAWLDGDVTLAELVEAHEAGSVHKLARRIRRSDAGLEEACRAALRDKSPDVADSTLSGYEHGLGRFRAFAASEGLEGVREALTTSAVQRVKGWCAEEDDVAEETINNRLTALSVLVTFAEREGWIDERPKIRKYESEVRIVWLESEDLASYFAEVRPRSDPSSRSSSGAG